MNLYGTVIESASRKCVDVCQSISQATDRSLQLLGSVWNIYML